MRTDYQLDQLLDRNYPNIINNFINNPISFYMKNQTSIKRMINTKLVNQRFKLLLKSLTGKQKTSI